MSQIIFIKKRVSATPLLDDYGGALAAMSTRLLRTAYTGDAIRIREDGGDTEADIGFDANGNLDTAAIASHCGANNGFVKTWYDQSGNGNDFAQSVAGQQPKIYDGANTLTTSNSKPALDFDGVDDNMWKSSLFTGNVTRSWLAVVEGATDDAQIFGKSSHAGALLDLYTLGVYIKGGVARGKATFNDADKIIVGTTSLTTDQTHRIIAKLADNDFEIWLDGTSEATKTNETIAHYTSYTTAGIGAGKGSSTSAHMDEYDGFIGEVVVWESDQAANAAGIDANCEGYWG